jgi:hypothetical protein
MIAKLEIVESIEIEIETERDASASIWRHQAFTLSLAEVYHVLAASAGTEHVQP